MQFGATSRIQLLHRRASLPNAFFVNASLCKEASQPTRLNQGFSQSPAAACMIDPGRTDLHPLICTPIVCRSKIALEKTHAKASM